MNICDKDELDVVVVVDGRPGHEKQSLGIVQGLENRVTVNRTIIDVSTRGFLPQVDSYLKLLLNNKNPGIAGMPDKADLVICTGTRTHTTALLLKKYFHVPAAACMTPGVHLRNQFDICFVPEHDGGKIRANFFPTCGAPNSNTNKGKHQAQNGLILVGGVDEKSHVWESGKIVENIVEIIEKDSEINWVISSSPRTPEATVNHIVEKIKESKNATFYDFKDTPKGWVEEQYDLCQTVWVTTDSISMLYEALSSGCTVNVMPMSWKKDSSKFKKNEDLLVRKRLVTPFFAWKRGTGKPTELAQLNEAQRCADYILQTCWPRN